MEEERAQAAGADPAEPEQAPTAPPEKMTHREMLDQLGAMASQLADDAPPAVKEFTARAADLAAVAARSAGPFAHRVADVTGDAAERFADQSEHFAADLRGEDGSAGEPPLQPEGETGYAEAAPDTRATDSSRDDMDPSLPPTASAS